MVESVTTPLRALTRVLVVDDSAVARRMLRSVLESDPDIRVVGEASGGREAVDLTGRLRPDLVTMDLVMPDMNGMETTQRIMARHPTPVLFVSAHFGTGGRCTRDEALAAGALDVLMKPASEGSWPADGVAGTLVAKVKALARVPVIAHLYGARRILTGEMQPLDASRGSLLNLVAIGSSAGGPKVLEQILSPLPATYSLGVLVVQHMSVGFTGGLLEWLQQRCALPVAAARDGEPLVPGRILFAPEGAHLVVRPGGSVHLSLDPPINGHRPSVDALFQSVAKVYGPRSAGVLLTGMGVDGAEGLLAIREAGGVTLAQDEQSCVVFGMPRAAIALGAVHSVLSPVGIGRSLMALHADRVQELL